MSLFRQWLQPISRERRQDVFDELSQASSPGFDYFLLVMLSCSIATFGLITNSAAVIIGAMLVAPLMSPILGLSLASVVAEERLFRKAVLALVEGILLAFILSAFWAWLARTLPFDLLMTLPSEVLARTQPTPFDLGIALAGGAAASYALAHPRISAALPGVAIATALMPPLCTAGIGIATTNWDVALGAMLLFVTNLAAISFAGILVFVALGFRPMRRRARRILLPGSLLISAALVMMVTVPLVLLTLRLVEQSRFNKHVHDTVAAQVGKIPFSELLEIRFNQTDSILNIEVTILTTNPPSHRQVVAIQEEIALELDQQTALKLVVVPGTRLDPLIPPTRTPTIPFTPTTTQPPPTVTLTPTLTYTYTPTLTFTPTAVLAFIANTGGIGVFIFETPAGKIFYALPEGSPVHILYRREIADGVEWLEIRLPDDRVGWIPTEFVIIRP